MLKLLIGCMKILFISKIVCHHFWLGLIPLPKRVDTKYLCILIDKSHEILGVNEILLLIVVCLLVVLHSMQWVFSTKSCKFLENSFFFLNVNSTHFSIFFQKITNNFISPTKKKKKKKKPWFHLCRLFLYFVDPSLNLFFCEVFLFFVANKPFYTLVSSSLCFKIALTVVCIFREDFGVWKIKPQLNMNITMGFNWGLKLNPMVINIHAVQITMGFDFLLLCVNVL
jgi:hypothetical protein